jgi:hypothetical protein
MFANALLCAVLKSVWKISAMKGLRALRAALGVHMFHDTN